MDPKQWVLLCSFAKVSSQLCDLPDHVTTFIDDWKAWFDNDEPQDCEMPGEYSDLDSFRKMLVVRAFRPEKVMYSIQSYVKEALGQ